MTPTRLRPLTRTSKIARRLLYFAGLGFFSAACLMPAVVPGFMRQTLTPAPIDYCATVGAVQIVWPLLGSVAPARAHPGETIRVTGAGGYYEVDCPTRYEAHTGERLFKLYWDGQLLAEIVCEDEYCESALTVPHSARPGTHFISAEGGSTVEILVVADTPTRE